MRWLVVRVLLLLALGGFYVVAATEHARSVNTFKARGDQSGYLWDAQNMYSNWHGGPNQPMLIGERNRMPLYAAFLAVFWTPTLSNDDFFDKAKQWNIYLSLGLLAVLAMIFAAYLPPIVSTNLTLIVAFGYFIFKAGYTQSELLFYFLFFVAFLLLWEILTRRAGLKATLIRAVAAGGVAALAHLTKASLPPLVGIFLAVCAFNAFRRLRIEPPTSLKQMAAALAVGGAFLLVLSPYLRTNERVFGHYFYNVNTTFYMWYDDWPQASIGTIKHGDGVGWPTMPIDELPSASRYWREHTMGQILARIGGGLWDMVNRSYKTYWYLTYLGLYLGFTLAVALKRWRELHETIRRHREAFVFLLLYAVVHLVGIAFYAPVSGTGTTRFLIAHLTPLFFVTSLFLARDPFRHTEWAVAGSRIGVRHFHLAISLMLAFDIGFRIWPRLMTTYGGF